MLELYKKISGEEPVLYGTIIGFGHYHYHYPSGREGDAAAGAFAPRKAGSVIYISNGLHKYEEQLAQLGAHKTGVGCLYITDLEKVDVQLLTEIIEDSYATLNGTIWRERARNG